MAKEITLPSGNKLELGYASFEEVGKLRGSISEKLKTVSLDGAKDLTSKDIVSLVKELPSLIESDDMKAIIFECSKRSIVVNKKGDRENLTPSYFSNPDYWQDYYPAIKSILEHNLNPFVRGLIEALPKKAKNLLSQILQ